MGQDLRTIIFTPAYNAEKTLERTIKSVLDQTDRNIVYHLLDNGSTDSTREIILNYANKDKRIVPVLSQMNHRHPDFKGDHPYIDFMTNLCKKESNESFFAFLDADDEYKPDFLEKMIGFLKENNLNIASCCSDHINADTGENLNRVFLSENIVVSENEFGEKFEKYFRYMGSLWGKLFSIRTLKKCNFINLSQYTRLKYSFDTIMCLEIIEGVERIGVLGENLHTYYIYNRSNSSDYLEKRYEANRFMIDVYRNFLKSKAGLISTENESYICGIFLRSILNTSLVVFNADWDIVKKITVIFDAVKCKATTEILEREDAPIEDKHRLANTIIDWANKQAYDGEEKKDLISFLSEYAD